jgi:hypothetical protein
MLHFGSETNHQKVIRINNKNYSPITMDEKCSSRVPYPGSIFTVEGGSEEDVKARI